MLLNGKKRSCQSGSRSRGKPARRGIGEGGRPRSTRKQLAPEQFFRAVREYPEKDGTCTYIYRVWPVIDKKLEDEKAKTYIDKVAEPIDEAYLLKHWGSGDFSLKFTDENKPRGHTQVCQTLVHLWDPEIPPVIEDYAELVLEAPANRSFVKGLRARGILPQEGEVQKTGSAGPGGFGAGRPGQQHRPW